MRKNLFCFTGIVLFFVVMMAGCAPIRADIPSTPTLPPPTAVAVLPSPTHTPGPTITPHEGQSIPAMPTLAETPTQSLVSLPYGRTPAAPNGTPFFPVPTRLPLQMTPELNCAAVYPPETVLNIADGSITVEQVTAAFGPVISVTGRPPRLRFEDRGCLLLVAAGMTYVQSAELRPYFSLGELLERYGNPAAVAEIPASIDLPGRDRLALLYPEAGLAALFEDPPEALSAAIPEVHLFPPTDVAGMIDHLGHEGTLIDTWQPPLF